MSEAEARLRQEVENALRNVGAIGDPDQIRDYAESVVDFLKHNASDYGGGWLIVNHEVHPVENVVDSWEDDGYRRYDILTVVEEDPE